MTATLARPAEVGTASRRRRAGTSAVAILLLVLGLLGIAVGAKPIPLDVVWAALHQFDPANPDHVVVIEQRIPRTVLGIVVGAALGVAGALMQAMTRNPLADPGLLGVSAGAGFAMTLAVAFLPITSLLGYVWFAFAGAVVATVAVYALGTGRRGSNPLTLVLAGVSIGAVLSGLTLTLTLLHAQAFLSIRVWETGSLADRGWDIIVPVTAFVLIGLGFAASAARGLNAIALGDYLAAALGANARQTPVVRGRRRHPAVRSRDRRDGPGLVRRPDGPACGALDLRPRPAPDPRAVPADRARPDAGRRPAGTGAGAPRRTPGRTGHRLRRCPRADPAGPPHPGEGAVTGQVVRLDRRSLVWRAGVASVRFRARTAGACVVLVALVLLIAVVALGLGSFQVSAPDVVRGLFGQGPQAIQTLVVKWRLSRVVLALLIGVALGASGAVFQSLTRNPLGSPDIVGFSSGAYAGAVVAIILVDLNQASVVTGALIGGLLTAAVVYLLAYRQGVQGFRLIVVGIAVTAMLGSATTYLLVHTDLWRAQLAAIWGAGSINGMDWDEVRAIGVLLLVSLPAVLLLSRRLSILELGDDAAAGLGVRVEAVRLGLVLFGVALIAVPSALAGPIQFVALASPHIARALTRGTGALVVPSALVGAFLMIGCDVIAQHLFAPMILPVGLVTIVLGGGYLTWLIARQTRRELR